MRSPKLAGLALAMLLIPVAAQAATVCCSCAPTKGAESRCLNVDSTKLTDATNCTLLPGTLKTLNDWTCQPVPLNETQCRTVAKGGVCTTEPQEAAAAGGGSLVTGGSGTTPAAPQGVIPKLNTQIPGLAFTGSAATPDNSLLLAQYVSAVYRYGLSIVAVAATIMMVFGAFLYLIGATTGDIIRGKRIMTDAIIGMLLVIGANLILRTINPATVILGSLNVTPVKTEVTSYMAGNKDAQATLTSLGLAPAANVKPSLLKIPRGVCPGRDPKYTDDGVASIGRIKITKRLYTLAFRGQRIDDHIIDKYEQEQARSNVPGGVLMAQIFNEAGGACYVLNLFDNIGSCGTAEYIKYYNFGGIGCTQTQVPANSCAHVAFTQGAYELVGKKPHPLPCTTFNSSVAPACVNICEQGPGTRETYKECGDKCFPLKSNASIVQGDQEIWIPSVQCSRKYKNVQEFLDSHLAFVKACLPYNDSVYKFAYCIGASTYAGVTGAKGLVLAEIIERNCLCDPETDSLHCKRDLQLEADLSKNIVKKRNLYMLYKKGAPDYDAIAQALYESTGGRLVPGELNPENDLGLPAEDPS